jgi:hypothetical protein
LTELKGGECAEVVSDDVSGTTAGGIATKLGMLEAGSRACCVSARMVGLSSKVNAVDGVEG